ncbi:MAG: HEAT repeat domain-containing protein [Bacteroides sp.]|jgi:protein-S-isoprenylcysteine O-methyltransferase Ste14|nr:HEAT repeat domain-containing protein [Bacteroides sp.]
MRNKILENTGLFLLAVVFSIGLMFAFTELPRLMDQLIQAMVHTPGSDPAYDAMRIELFYQAYAIRLIGYICLGLIVLFIILGFTTRKTGWAMAGGVALFLPVFATFAHSMFYLAGLGLFNVILFPFLDISLALVDLGKVVLIPYWILMWCFGLFNWYARDFLVYLFMLTGAFIFVLGVFAWLQARFGRQKVAKHWIYKYSRHPQYLGWIIWSYGLMLYGPLLNEMKKSWGWNGTLPWLLSTLVIIGICLLEEIKMKERAGDDYDEYRNRTPFLFPIPGLLNKIIKAPARLVIQKNRPESRKEAGVVIALYAFIFMSLSLFWVDLSPQGNRDVLASKPYSRERANALIGEIRREQPRRYRSFEPFAELLSMGQQAYPDFFELMEDPDPDVRQFAIQAAAKYGIREAIPSLIGTLDDPEPGITESAIQGLGDLAAREATDTLLYILENPGQGIRQDVLLTALSKMGCISIMPYLEKRLQDTVWHHYTATLQAMMRLDPEAAKPYVYESLKDERQRVRMDAVNLLLETLPDDALPYLEEATHDPNWEVRFYARQGMRLIREKQHKP